MTCFGQKVKTQQQNNKRAQTALGRSPEEEVKGQVKPLPLEDLSMKQYTKYLSSVPCTFQQEDY